MEIYAEFLGDYAEPILEHAAKLTIADWREPSKMPTIAFILERCTTALIEKQRRALDEKRQAETQQNVLDELMNHRPAGVSHDDVLRWLEEGKQKQRDYIAKLNACTTEAEKTALARQRFNFDNLPF